MNGWIYCRGAADYAVEMDNIESLAEPYSYHGPR